MPSYEGISSNALYHGLITQLILRKDTPRLVSLFHRNVMENVQWYTIGSENQGSSEQEDRWYNYIPFCISASSILGEQDQLYIRKIIGFASCCCRVTLPKQSTLPKGSRARSRWTSVELDGKTAVLSRG